MNWIEIIVHTTSIGAEFVSDLLLNSGASGTQTEDRADIPDPAKPHGVWEIIDPNLLSSMPEDVLVHAWFSMEICSSDFFSKPHGSLQSLQEKSPAVGKLTLETKIIPDEDWGESWKRSYHPLRAGKHLIIKPSWEECDLLPGDHVIELDPGMAFGSGYHDTTRLCLTLMEKYLSPGDSVIDVGTGSGILAIGAALSGAGNVLAIDIDADAVRVARSNVAHHGLENRIHVLQGNLMDQISETCDLCLANIIADIICSFSSSLLRHIRPGGILICSGIILERTDEVLKCLLDAGFILVEKMSTEEWTAFCVRRPG